MSQNVCETCGALVIEVKGELVHDAKLAELRVTPVEQRAVMVNAEANLRVPPHRKRHDALHRPTVRSGIIQQPSWRSYSG